MNSNSIMNSFLLSKDKELGSNKISYTSSAIDLQNLCKSIVNDTLDWNIVLTTWIWLNDIWVPIRCPALIIPALKIIRNLVNLWINNIEYSIYQATSFIIKENSLDENLAKNNSKIIQNYLKWYILEYYNDIFDKISFDFNLDLDENNLLNVAENIKWLLWNQDINLAMWKLVNYAESKWKSETSAFIYGSANIVSNWHVGDYYPVKNESSDIIIPIWWKKEKPFFNLWKVYEENYNVDYNKKIIIPLLQKTWEIPTYYPSKWEDYISSNYEFIPLSWDKLNHLVEFDRNIILSELWVWFEFNKLIQKILW